MITHKIHRLVFTMLGCMVLVTTLSGCPRAIVPAVSLTNPPTGATGVPINMMITATFTVDMDPSTITADTFILMNGTMSVPGSVNYSGVTATFNPTADLAPNTLYTAVITTGASTKSFEAGKNVSPVDDSIVASVFGEHFTPGNSSKARAHALPEEYSWTFTTGSEADTAAPSISSTSPMDGEINVSVNKKIAVYFSEAMDPSTLTTTTFTLNRGVTPISGMVTCSGLAAVFTPDIALALNSAYTCVIWMEATDLASNTLAEDYTWIFTTGDGHDYTAPMLDSTYPVNGAVDVPINKKITAVFSEPMNPLLMNTTSFVLKQGENIIPGAVTCAGVTATFTPAINLTPEMSYTSAITTGAEDLAANPLAENYEWTFTTGVTMAQEPIDLRSTSAFAILAGSTVANTGPSIITGDLGVSPGSAIIGFPPGVLNGSSFFGVDSAAGQAKIDLNTAFNEAAGRSTDSVSLPGDLSGLTLYPGLYTNSTSVMLSAGNLTLDAQGDANAVFLFQMGSTLTTGTNTQVVLSGGAKAGNVYWKVGSSATLGTYSNFMGNILAQESITMTIGSTLVGRALTQTAAVTLDNAVITAPAP